MIICASSFPPPLNTGKPPLQFTLPRHDAARNALYPPSAGTRSVTATVCLTVLVTLTFTLPGQEYAFKFEISLSRIARCEISN